MCSRLKSKHQHQGIVRVLRTEQFTLDYWKWAGKRTGAEKVEGRGEEGYEQYKSQGSASLWIRSTSQPRPFILILVEVGFPSHLFYVLLNWDESP